MDIINVNIMYLYFQTPQRILNGKLEMFSGKKKKGPSETNKEGEY
jgi:hypothetical protein